MDNSTKHELAKELSAKFDQIDVDKNGFLNLLEIEKFTSAVKDTDKERMKLAASNYENIINVEDDTRKGRIGFETKNDYGISKGDLLALEKLTSGEPNAVSWLARRKAMEAVAPSAFLGSTLGLFSAGTWAGDVAAAVLGGSSLVGAAVLGFGAGAVIGGTIYGVTRYKANNYYTLKKESIKSW